MLIEALRTDFTNNYEELKRVSATNKAETDASIANANRTIEANKAETDASIANTNQTIATNKIKTEQDISNLQAIKAEIYYSNEDVPTLTIENVGTK